MQTLTINEKGDYTIMNEETNTITFEEVEQRLKGKKLEEYTDQDVFDRFIGYGDTEELEQPEIQKLLIQHGYVVILVDMVDTIIDNEVIEFVYSSDLFNDTNIRHKQGKISNIEFTTHNDIPECKSSIIHFTDTDNGETIILNGHLFLDNQELENYKNKLEQLGENVTVIYESKDNKLYLKCFMQEGVK